MAEHFPKKIFSPNSPFAGQSVFSFERARSWAAGGRVRIVSMRDAVAALTGNVAPKRWSRAWMLKKLGAPGDYGDMVMLFNSDFIVRVHGQFAEQARATAGDIGYNDMVDMARGGDGRRGVAVWTSRGHSKIPGGPVRKVRQMRIVFKKVR